MHENYRLKTDEIQKTLIKETYKHELKRPASTFSHVHDRAVLSPSKLIPLVGKVINRISTTKKYY